MHKNTAFSVALCTHNGANFINQQIHSILQQNLLPTHIVVSDDASIDNCTELIKEIIFDWKNKYPKKTLQLQIFNNISPLKTTKNFEQAIIRCSGELIALCDQDDIWHPTRLDKIKNEFQNNPNLFLIHSNARLINSQGEILPESLFDALEVRPFELKWIHQQRAFDVFLRRNLVTGATTVFRRSLLQYALPFPNEWLHDEWLAIIAAAIGGVDVLEEPLIYYRQHALNQIGARRIPVIAKIRKAFSQRDHTLADRVIKIEVLLERLKKFEGFIPSTVLEKLQKKLEHQRFRANLPKNRWARFLPVLCEIFTGRYNQFGRGFHSIARDLFESA